MALGIIGAALGAAGTVAGNIMSIINNRKAEAANRAEAARQQAYYNARANEDPLSKTSNQKLLNQYDRTARKQIKDARNVAAITGATPEFTLAIQDSVAQGRADLMGNMAANQDLVQEKALEQAELARQNLATQQQAIYANRDKAYANLVTNAANAATSLINGMQPKKDDNNIENSNLVTKATKAINLLKYGMQPKKEDNKQQTGQAVEDNDKDI